MGVLAREIDAYKRAVEQYNRQLRRHNQKVESYNQTLVVDNNGNAVITDAVGNMYAVDKQGRLSGYTPPDGRTMADYGRAPIEGDNRFQLLRQNPTERRAETVTGVQRQQGVDGGPDSYVVPNNEGSGMTLGAEWRRVSEQPATSEGGQPTYTFERDASTYMDKPGDFTGKLRASKPDPSMAQVRRMFGGGPAQQERGGLLGDVIRGNGLATGGTPTQYRSGSVIRQPNQQTEPGGTTPIDPNYRPNNPFAPQAEEELR